MKLNGFCYYFSPEDLGAFYRHKPGGKIDELVGWVTTNPPENSQVIYFLDEDQVSFLGNSWWGETYQSLLTGGEFDNEDIGLRCLQTARIRVQLHESYAKQESYIEILEQDFDEPKSLVDLGYDPGLFLSHGNPWEDKYTVVEIDGGNTVLINNSDLGFSLNLPTREAFRERFYSTLHAWSRIATNSLVTAADMAASARRS